MKSAVRKRSIIIDGHKTSISMEEPFWQALRDIARQRGLNLSALVGSIKAARAENSNLSSAVRVHILAHVRTRLSELREASWQAASTQPPGERIAEHAS